jgi:hypothetical protein
LRRVSAGASFAEAFQGATGYALPDFERDAIRRGLDAAALGTF